MPPISREAKSVVSWGRKRETENLNLWPQITHNKNFKKFTLISIVKSWYAFFTQTCGQLWLLFFGTDHLAIRSRYIHGLMSKLMAHILSFSTYWTLNTWCGEWKKKSSKKHFRGKFQFVIFISARLQIDKNESIFFSLRHP